MAKVERKCEHCQKEFLAEQKEVSRGFGRFCSKACSSTFNNLIKLSTRQNNVTCSTCGVLFYKNSSKQANSKSGLFFCSRACKNSAQRIGGIKAIMPSHYGIVSPLGGTKEQLVKLRGARTARSEISRNSRQLYVRSGKPTYCIYCGYSTRYEVCHIRPVSDFPKDALISEINALTNLIALCPNHHLEFDNGELLLGDIIDKMSDDIEELEDLIFDE